MKVGALLPQWTHLQQLLISGGSRPSAASLSFFFLAVGSSKWWQSYVHRARVEGHSQWGLCSLQWGGDGYMWDQGGVAA